MAPSALCLAGAVVITCSSEIPTPHARGNTQAGGGASTATSGSSGGASTVASGSNGVGGAAGGATGTGGSGTGGTTGNPCPDCVDFGLDTRPVNTTCVAGNPPPASYRFGRVWQGVTFTTALGLIPSPDGTMMVVNQKSGVAIAVPMNPAATQAQTRTFLDLRTIINTDVESGLLSMAFHPNYAQNGFVYAVYTRNDGQHSTRVARFKTNNNGQSLDLASEQKVYEHTQVRGTHHGGDMHFGPDGYLYVSFGDNNTGDDHTDFTAQNRRSLYGSVVRLDVNVPGAGYKIPPDNPYANGVNGAPEIYAKGFRNPWRFSFDRLTKELWLADPGEEANGIKGENGIADPYEEIDRVTLGGFYGWPFFQGTHCYHDCTVEKGLPPEFEFSHNGGPAAVIGGYVYRGSAMPGLVGKYIFGEYESGETFAYDPQTKMRTSLGFGGKVTSFGQDGEGEIYACRENGQIEKLQNASMGMGGFPDMLSKTGCVNAADPKQVASGVIPFSVALPFWSDGAEKERYLALPDGKTFDVAADGDFTLPVGAVTMKNFKWQGKLFETRFFVRHNDGSYYGYSYEWNADQTDATLVNVNGKEANVGGLMWTYPSRTACFTCHSEAAGRSLGLETRQLNSVGMYPSTGRKANQFNTLLHIGMLSGNTAPRDPFPAKDDMRAPLDTRARAYLAANCSNCHRPNGPGRGRFNALFDTPLQDMGICNQVPEQGDLGISGASVLKPGSHASSVLWLRMSQRMANFMPPIASKIPDTVGADLLAAWIDGLAACP
jgi:uncharacterized repeat protein (TIGR03806 family)